VSACLGEASLALDMGSVVRIKNPLPSRECSVGMEPSHAAPEPVLSDVGTPPDLIGNYVLDKYRRHVYNAAQ